MTVGGRAEGRPSYSAGTRAGAAYLVGAMSPYVDTLCVFCYNVATPVAAET